MSPTKILIRLSGKASSSGCPLVLVYCEWIKAFFSHVQIIWWSACYGILPGSMNLSKDQKDISLTVSTSITSIVTDYYCAWARSFRWSTIVYVWDTTVFDKRHGRQAGGPVRLLCDWCTVSKDSRFKIRIWEIRSDLVCITFVITQVVVGRMG